VLIGHAIAWLKLNSGRPFFQWLHFMDPHAPYYPKRQAPEQLGNGSISPRHAKYLNSFWARADVNTKRLHKKRDEIMTLYDAGIRWVDSQVQRLAETLVDLNMWNHCTMAVTADHGEEFLDHGGRFHAPLMLHQELVHVPLLLHGSGFKPQVMDQPIGLIDLAPTLLDHLQVSVPPSFRGHSCWSHLQTNGTWDWPVVSECVRGCTNPYRESDRIGPRILAVRKGRFKLVVDFSAGIERLFDLERDPCEQAPSPPDAERAIRRDLLECARRHVAESHQSRDFNHRFDSKSRDLRLEWAHSRATTTN
jgi:arylsulfatase A-like enzyme